MSGDIYENNHLPPQLQSEILKVLHNGERLFELITERLGWYCGQLTDHLMLYPFRLGIVGYPGIGKSTYAVSAVDVFTNIGYPPCTYCELDIYASTAAVIRGEIHADERLKREDAPQDEVMASIREYTSGSGLVIGDFPGRLLNEYQESRIAVSDLILILGSNYLEMLYWLRFIKFIGTPSVGLLSRPDLSMCSQVGPLLAGLNRRLQGPSMQMCISLTKLLEIIAELRGVRVFDPWEYFSTAERYALRFLDRLYTPVHFKK